jgi:hypothetical protein
MLVPALACAAAVPAWAARPDGGHSHPDATPRARCLRAPPARPVDARIRRLQRDERLSALLPRVSLRARFQAHEVREARLRARDDTDRRRLQGRPAWTGDWLVSLSWDLGRLRPDPDLRDDAPQPAERPLERRIRETCRDLHHRATTDSIESMIARMRLRALLAWRGGRR